MNVPAKREPSSGVEPLVGLEKRLLVARRRWVSVLYLGSAGIAVASFTIIGNDPRVIDTSLIFASVVTLLFVGTMLRLRQRRTWGRVVSFAVGFSCGAFLGGLLSPLFAMYSGNTPTFMMVLFALSTLGGIYGSSSPWLRRRL